MMLRTLLRCSAICALVACGGSPSEENAATVDRSKVVEVDKRIALLDAAVADGGTPEEMAELRELSLLQAEDATLPATKRLDRHRYLAELAYLQGEQEDAYQRLVRAIADFRGASTIPEAALMTAEIAIRRRAEPHTAELIFAALRRDYASDPTLNQIPAVYPKLSADSLLRARQQEIYGANGFDREAAIRYGQATLPYAALLQDDSLRIATHIASGRVLEQAAYYPLALQHLGEVVRLYPGRKQAGDALFLQAFIHDEYMEDTTMARTLYERFIGEYPNHLLIADAQRMLGEQ